MIAGMRRLVLGFAAFLVLAYAAYAGIFWWNQRYLLFPRATQQYAPFATPLPGYARLVELPASFGKVRAVFLRGPAGRAPVILYTHGNGEVIDQHVRNFDAIRGMGFHVLLLEYPGYGGADGAPGYDSIMEAVTTAYDWLVAQPEVDGARIVTMGKSLGGAPAAALTGLRPVRAVVLQSTFSAMSAFAAQYGLPAFIVRDPFDSAARLKAFDGPVLIAHGRHDELIAFAQGEALAAAAHAPVTRWYDCGHNDCPYDGADYLGVLREFLVRVAR